VARLSLSLFDQLGKVHGMGEAERRLLHAAAVLHDIGDFVSYGRHHKHSLYLIANSSLPGFSPQEMAVVANVARYHRRSAPKPEHEAYAALDGRSRVRVTRLAALLRLADAMDREHAQKVYNVRAKVQGRVLKLRLEGQGDLLLEGWALKKKSDLLKVALGLAVEVEPRMGSEP
jgi:exopolyphosphatase/guanosine-5'-triphosphate,3'-diphosphate pyrophosphatase